MEARSVPSRFVGEHLHLLELMDLSSWSPAASSASTASPSPAAQICETASVGKHPYLVNTFPRMRPDAESMSQAQHSHVAQRSTPLPSHPALTYTSDAEGRSARQTSLSCESR
jgi:hypothetical protein